MKPNKRIQELTNENLIENLTNELTAVGAQKYGNNEFSRPRFNKKNINMMKTELLERLNKVEI